MNKINGYIWGESETQFFYALTPETILDAVEALGFSTTGRCLTLNSMENRVYEIEIEIDPKLIKSASDSFIVAKFYRPGRWSKEQILDEHHFLNELMEEEVPVIAPLLINGESVFKLEEANLWYSIFPKKSGRSPQELTTPELQTLGRQMARMHIVGKSKKSKYRLELNLQNFASNNLNDLLTSGAIPAHHEKTYESLVLEFIERAQSKFNGIQNQRIHGDCHWGNIISRADEGMFFIDFDDMLVGPCVQDLWLILPYDGEEGRRQQDTLLDAYESMTHFDDRELRLIEPLRAMRYIHFTNWISKRWEDQAFKRAFPDFGSEYYFQMQINDLRDQLEKI